MIKDIMTSQRAKSLLLLRDGFKQDFAMKVFESEKFFELLQELSIDFVDDNIPVVDDDVRHDLAFLLCESIKLGNY